MRKYYYDQDIRKNDSIGSRESMAEMQAPSINAPVDLITQSNSDGQQLIPTQDRKYFSFEWVSQICSCFCDAGDEAQDPISLSQKLLPEQSEECSGLKTLVLDLDETLVHSSFNTENVHDIMIEIELNGIKYQVFVAIRQGVKEFLDKMSEIYEVVIFTASLAKVRFMQYANPVLDYIDPEQKIQHRLYRDSCSTIGGSFVKDLSRLGRDLKDVIIIDVIYIQNSPNSYRLQPQNAIPIVSWFDDRQDTELLKLIPALESLASVEDVTIYIEPLQQKGVPANLFHQHLTQSTDEIRDNDQSFSDIPLINNPHRGNFNSPIGADGKHFEFDEGEED